MAFVPKEGCGNIFNNAKKSERGPDMRGDIMLNGVLYEVAAWKRSGKFGEFLSMAVKPKQQTPAPTNRPSPSEDIPF